MALRGRKFRIMGPQVEPQKTAPGVLAAKYGHGVPY